MINIIVNGANRTNKPTKALAKLEARLQQAQLQYTVHVTQYCRHATEIAQQLTVGHDIVDIVSVGGDGTLSEIVRGIDSNCRVRLGIIPAGTGNDYLKVLDNKRSIDRAIDNVVAGKTRDVDYISMPQGGAINVIGAGMDVDTLVKYNSMTRFKGKVKYYIALLHVLTHLQFHKLRIIIDGIEYEREVFMIAIANGQYIGGGMPVAPNSQIDNGKLNVVIINKLPKRKILSILLKFLKGKHVNDKCVEQFFCDNAILEVLDEGKIQLDGEIIDEQRVECQVVAGGISLYNI